MSPEKELKKFDRTLIICLMEAIELSAENMAKKIVSSKRGRKKSEEEGLKEIKELTEIKKTAFVLKKQLGLIPEEEEFK